MMRSSLPSAVVLFVLAGSAQAQFSWSNSFGGLWSVPGNWTPVGIPDAAGESVLISLGGVYAVRVDINAEVDSLTISNSQATAAIGPHTLTIAAGGFQNDALVLVNADGTPFNSVLSFTQDATIVGSGEIFLNATTNNDDAIVQSTTGITLTNPASHLIQGSGRIAGQFVNQGDVIGNDPLGIGIQMTGFVTQTGAGRLRGDGSIILLSSATVNGGRLQGVNGGAVVVGSGTSIISGVTITGAMNIPGTGGAVASMSGSITNNGTISINPESSVFNGLLRFDSTSTINGTGQIVLKANTSPDDAQLTAISHTGTLSSGQTVRGSGRMQGSFINNGIIRADDPAQPLQMFSATITNNGLLSAQGANITLQASSITGGTLNSSGGGSVLTTSGTSSVSGITNSGSLAVSGNGGAVLDISGPIVNNGTITLNPEESVFNALLRFQTSTSITGNGSIVLVTNSNADDAQITAISSTGTFGASQTIRGAGRMQGIFVNNGIIRADDPADPLVVNATVNNNGQFVAQDANLDLSAATVTGGTFTSSGTGRVRVSNGASSISGVTNNGQLAVKGSGGAFLDLAGPLTNNSTITINPDAEVFNAIVRAQTNMTIAGTGDVVLLAVNNIDDAQLQALSGIITIGADQTVRGAGRLQGTFVNNGVIRAEDPAFTLQLFGSAVTNNGVLSGQDADLTLRDTAVTGGALASSGTGFVLANSGLNTMTDVTNTGSMGVSGTGGAFLDLNGSFINNGTITLNPEISVFNAILRFGSTTSIGGAGDIVLVSNNNTDDAQIVNSGPEVTISAGQTVRGTGRLTGDIRVEGGINPEGVFREIEHTGLSILTLSGSSTATFDIGGTAASAFDRITSAATVSLEGGHCEVRIDPSFTPLPGDSWDIVSADTVSGRFNSYDLPVSPVAGYVYRVFYQPDRAFVRLTCGSDFDGDGTLNFFDVAGFLADYNAQDPRADVAAPFGQWNFFDISAFLGAYSTGCP